VRLGVTRTLELLHRTLRVRQRPAQITENIASI
jgi:hypothetical protein